MAAVISVGVAFMPRPAILSTVDCQAARSWRRETERSISWHWAQSFSTSDLPGPAGSWAKADTAAKKNAPTNRGMPGRKACATEELVFDGEAECIEGAVLCT